MRLLLDTHAFLWFITNDSQLSAAARVLIADQLRCSLLEWNRKKCSPPKSFLKNQLVGSLIKSLSNL